MGLCIILDPYDSLFIMFCSLLTIHFKKGHYPDPPQTVSLHISKSSIPHLIGIFESKLFLSICLSFSFISVINPVDLSDFDKNTVDSEAAWKTMRIGPPDSDQMAASEAS